MAGLFIIGIIMCLLMFLIAFFLFAMWRAIIGKSSIDFKLAEMVHKNTKSLGEHQMVLSAHAKVEANLESSMNDLRRVMDKLPTELASKLERTLTDLENKNSKG